MSADSVVDHQILTCDALLPGFLPVVFFDPCRIHPCPVDKCCGEDARRDGSRVTDESEAITDDEVQTPRKAGRLIVESSHPEAELTVHHEVMIDLELCFDDSPAQVVLDE